MQHAVPLAGGLECIGGEAGAAVGQHVRDPEGVISPVLVEAARAGRIGAITTLQARNRPAWGVGEDPGLLSNL